MNVLFISECSGQALTQSRRILDQFAERRGERTWQTAITKDGLDAVRMLLRKTARKNSAVACHWIRGIDHTELLWIVGNAKRFSAQGAVPTNTTSKDVLRRANENDWHSLRDIYLLAALASLLHDLGKACKSFQDRLIGKNTERNLYRHEWISLRLFQAFVGSDDDEKWLSRLANPKKQDDDSWLDHLQRDGMDATSSTPFKDLPMLAQAIGWLVVTHHRLPCLPSSETFSTELLHRLPNAIVSSWNEDSPAVDSEKILTYWTFPHGLPVTTALWRDRAARVARKLLDLRSKNTNVNYLENPFVMHLARLSLMLADHDYSAFSDAGRIQGTPNYPLYANTDGKTGKLKQTLDEHLLGVERLSGQVTHALLEIASELPRLARHRTLRQRSANEAFRWQDRAADLAASVREEAARNGAFIVNMASTGCGKTLANARIMYALANPASGMRCAFALGLRTLTRQTGKEYRQRLSLSEDEVATLVGGSSTSALFDHYQALAAETGSESMQSLLPEDGHIIYEGSVIDNPRLERLFGERRSEALIAAPMLVCTIDHLVPATESTRGGRQIAPMLRLLSGDLVLDELDDYDIADLPAVTRLVHWAGLLGCRVLISSATLPPDLVHGMFEAYRNGRSHFQRNRGERPLQVPDICCIWVDEFNCFQSDCGDGKDFRSKSEEFATKRVEHLAKSFVRRRGELMTFNTTGLEQAKSAEIREQFALYVKEYALRLHKAHHEVDPKTGKRVSFGLVRMANIGPLFDVARILYKSGAPKNFRIHLCVYHSQYPLLLRSSIEHQLDTALDRRRPTAVFEVIDIRKRLDSDDAKEVADHLFIVLSSPVSEVGRDHDYDWAVVEPSSMRSLIQLAGRVQRHRKKECSDPNILIFDRNIRCLEHTGEPAYCRPGFENSEFRLSTHLLSELLTEQEQTIIDSRPRILKRQDLRPHDSLVDLEHARLERLMHEPPTLVLTDRQRNAGVRETRCGAYSWWTSPQAMLSGLLQREQQFRKPTRKQVDVVLLPNKDETDYALHLLFDEKNERTREIPIEESRNKRVCIESSKGILPWNQSNFMDALIALSEELNLDTVNCARRFATVTLPDSEAWFFHPALGFSEYKPSRTL